MSCMPWISSAAGMPGMMAPELFPGTTTIGLATGADGVSLGTAGDEGVSLGTSGDDGVSLGAVGDGVSLGIGGGAGVSVGTSRRGRCDRDGGRLRHRLRWLLPASLQSHGDHGAGSQHAGQEGQMWPPRGRFDPGGHHGRIRLRGSFRHREQCPCLRPSGVRAARPPMERSFRAAGPAAQAARPEDGTPAPGGRHRPHPGGRHRPHPGGRHARTPEDGRPHPGGRHARTPEDGRPHPGGRHRPHPGGRRLLRRIRTPGPPCGWSRDAAACGWPASSRWSWQSRQRRPDGAEGEA